MKIVNDKYSIVKPNTSPTMRVKTLETKPSLRASKV